MKTLITGGAGFIGRWLTKRLLADNDHLTVVDDFSNGRVENIAEFFGNPSFSFIEGDIRRHEVLIKVFETSYDIVYHLAAEINVQKSIDDPRQTFERDVLGTFNILEACRKKGTRLVFMSTCMVYDRSQFDSGIDELHPTKPASPYAAAKLSGEALVLSYYHAYRLPTVVIRPFNTYGPFQKANGEGGVVAIFIKNQLRGLPLRIYGEGSQTRDLLYVKDCVDFIVKAGTNQKALGQVVNAGTGEDITVNDLAKEIAKDTGQIVHVPHIHPQAEIQKLKCNARKAKLLLGWEPAYSLARGLEKTTEWIRENPDL